MVIYNTDYRPPPSKEDKGQTLLKVFINYNLKQFKHTDNSISTKDMITLIIQLTISL